MTPKKILLISYRFPPAPEVGSRRWGKFAKILARQGIEVHVLTADWKAQYCNSPWDGDVSNQNIFVHRVTGGINPNWLFGNKTGRLKKTLARIHWRLCSRKWVDVAEGWGRPMLVEARRILKMEGIQTVIANGPPFSVNFFASLLKLDHPAMRLIQDLRDPWNEDFHDFSYPHSVNSLRKKLRMIEYQRTAFQLADQVVTVSGELAEIFRKLWKPTKVEVISNGFDPEDYSSPSATVASPKLKVVHAGLVGSWRREAVDLLHQVVCKLAETDRFWVEQSEFRFIGDPGLKFNLPSFVVEGYLNKKELAAELSSARLGLMINNPEYPYAYGTKVFDYIGAGLPTLLISPEGELSRLMEKERAGYASTYREEDLIQCLLTLRNEFLGGKLRAVSDSVREQFSIPTLADRYRGLL